MKKFLSALLVLSLASGNVCGAVDVSSADRADRFVTNQYRRPVNPKFELNVQSDEQQQAEFSKKFLTAKKYVADKALVAKDSFKDVLCKYGKVIGLGALGVSSAGLLGYTGYNLFSRSADIKKVLTDSTLSISAKLKAVAEILFPKFILGAQTKSSKQDSSESSTEGDRGETESNDTNGNSTSTQSTGDISGIEGGNSTGINGTDGPQEPNTTPTPVPTPALENDGNSTSTETNSTAANVSTQDSATNSSYNVLNLIRRLISWFATDGTQEPNTTPTPVPTPALENDGNSTSTETNSTAANVSTQASATNSSYSVLNLTRRLISWFADDSARDDLYRKTKYDEKLASACEKAVGTTRDVNFTRVEKGTAANVTEPWKVVDAKRKNCNWWAATGYDNVKTCCEFAYANGEKRTVELSTLIKSE